MWTHVRTSDLNKSPWGRHPSKEIFGGVNEHRPATTNSNASPPATTSDFSVTTDVQLPFEHRPANTQPELRLHIIMIPLFWITLQFFLWHWYLRVYLVNFGPHFRQNPIKRHASTVFGGTLLSAMASPPPLHAHCCLTGGHPIYGVATISRLFQIIGLICRIQFLLQKRPII